MTIRAELVSGIAALALVASAAEGQAADNAGITAGPGDLAGTVTGASGPEAGVWVIAETTDLPTKFTKVVVTDERGRYLIPALPKANYRVWVRGYGLIDSAKVQAAPGKTVNLTATPAPTPAAAAEYYPPIYWFSMLRVPAKNEFPLGRVQNQPQWLHTLKTG